MSRKVPFSRKLIGVAAAVTMIGSLAACASSPSAPADSKPAGDSTESAATAEPEKITIGLPLAATTFTAVYLAEAEEIWAKHGLEVELLTFKGDAPLVKAVLSGDVDIAIASLTGAINAKAAGQGVSVFYGGFNMPGFSWYSVPEIASIEDSKGSSWGVSTLGSSTDMLTRYAAAQSGLDPDDDIKIIQGGGSAARLAAMEAGQIQVNIFAAPFNVIAEEKGYNPILELSDVVDNYPMHVSWSQPEFLAEREDVAKNYVAALSEAMQLVHDDKALAAAALVDAMKLEPEQAELSIESWIDTLYPDGRMVDQKSLDAFWEMALEGGIFDAKVPQSEWLDDRFLTGSK